MRVWYGARMTRIDKQKALRLRMQGKTYTDIQKALGGISKSTLSVWLKDVVLSEFARQALAARTKKKSFDGITKWSKGQTKRSQEKEAAIKRAAIQEINTISPRELVVVAAALYWAEGYKKPKYLKGKELRCHPVSLTNTDPKLAKIFLRCMAEICGVDISRINIQLRVFEHQNKDECIRYWSEQLAMPRENFTIVRAGISRSSMGKRPFNRLPYGVIQIRINSTDLFRRIMGWIEALKNNA